MPTDIEVILSESVVEVDLQELTIEVQQSGASGPAGAAGPQNLFVQQAAPTFTGPGLWFEIDGAGAPVTLWVNS